MTSDDVRADARRLREGITPEKWVKWEDFEAKEFTFDGIPRHDAEFIAAAPELTRGLLAELDRLQDHYSPDEVNRIREVNKNAQRDLVEVAESLKAERDAALATLQQVREWAEQRRHDGPPTDDLATVLLDGVAHQLFRILDGGVSNV